MSVNRFRAFTYVGDIKKELERAAELDLKHIDARWALIEFYIQLPGIFCGSEKKAIEYADELLQISPVDGYLAKGRIAEYSKRVKNAEHYYKKAIDVGRSPLTYQKLTSLYEKSNQPGKAIETASKFLKLHKSNELNYQIVKIAAESNVKYEYGIECLGNFIANHMQKDKTGKNLAYYRLAQIYKNLGQKEIALSWIEKALAKISDFPEAQREKLLILAL